MSGRCTKLEKEKRVFVVQGWIIDGVQDNLILKQIKTQWNVNLRQARKYLKAAHDNWRQEETVTIENRRSSKIAELKHLKRSLKSDYKGTPAGIRAIIAVEKEIIKLENITPPRVHVLEGNPEKPLYMSKKEIIIKERGR